MRALTLLESLDLDRPAEAVWAMIADFDALSKWLPPVASSVADKGNAIGSVRHLVLDAPGGPSFDEELTAYDAAGRSYSYTILAVDPQVLPVENYTSTLKVRDNGRGGAKVEWSGAFDAAPGVDGAAAVEAIRGVYRAGLGSLTKMAAAA
jgi:hypothetical protein